MNKLHADAEQYVQTLLDSSPVSGVQRFIIPPFTLLREVKSMLDGTDIRIGAQNMHWDDAGAWTGEISPPMLVDCGIEIVEIGHSERREHFGESDSTVGLKTRSAIRHGLIPLICIGENLQQRNSGESDSVLNRQVKAALEELEPDERKAPLLLAYEPVWAIGSNGVPADPDYANERQQRIIAAAEAILGYGPPCLYGGSVNAQNCETLIARPCIDGLFIGRAAWQAEGYLDIVDRCARTLQP